MDLHEINESHHVLQGRYELFTCEPCRATVFERLRQQLVADRGYENEPAIITTRILLG